MSQSEGKGLRLRTPSRVESLLEAAALARRSLVAFKAIFMAPLSLTDSLTRSVGRCNARCWLHDKGPVQTQCTDAAAAAIEKEGDRRRPHYDAVHRHAEFPYAGWGPFSRALL